MENEITLQDIERRLAALESKVASLTEKEEHADIDFSSIGGKLVRKAPEPDESPMPEGSLEAEFAKLGGILVLAPRPRE